MDSSNTSNLQRKQQIQKKIINVLKHAKISNNNYDSTQVPFFFKDSNKIDFRIDTSNNTINNTNNNANNNTINNMIPNGLNRNIKFIYSLLSNTSCEIYLEQWTFFSIDKALKIYNDFCKNGQSKVFDIGYEYMGLGHINVISCDLDTHLLFFRPDGGSNGYDRDDNFNYLIKNGTTPYKNKQMFFTSWFFEILKNSDKEF